MRLCGAALEAIWFHDSMSVLVGEKLALMYPTALQFVAFEQENPYGVT